jgi:hypothetical protein
MKKYPTEAGDEIGGDGIEPLMVWPGQELDQSHRKAPGRDLLQISIN